MADQTVTLSRDTLAQCRAFSNDSHSNRYQHQDHDPAKISEDIYRGKCGEFAVYQFLLDLGFPASLPDLTIYPTNKRNWDPDIRATIRNHPVDLQVKTSKNDELFGNSWVAQYASDRRDGNLFPIGTEPNSPEAANLTKGVKLFVALVTQLDIDKFDVKALLHVSHLHRFELFEEPILERLRGSKKVIYWDSNRFKSIRDALSQNELRQDPEFPWLLNGAS